MHWDLLFEYSVLYCLSFKVRFIDFALNCVGLVNDLLPVLDNHIGKGLPLFGSTETQWICGHQIWMQ